MSEHSHASHAVVFADACLLSAGAFCATTAILGLAAQMLPDGPGLLVMDVLGSLASSGSVLFGPIAALLLHGRRIGWLGAAGMLAGLAVTGVFGMLLPLVVRVVRTFASEGTEFGILIALLGLASMAFMGLSGSLTFRAWRDLRSGEPAHGRLDRYRLVCAALVALFAIAIGVLVIRDPASEIGEAPAFGLVFALAGGLMALGGDLLISLRKPPPPAHDAEASLAC